MSLSYTVNDVPDTLLGIRFVDAVYVDVVHSGSMVTTGNPFQDAANVGKIKNHWIYRFLVHPDNRDTAVSIRLSMDVVISDIASSRGVFAPSVRSIRTSSEFGSKKDDTGSTVASSSALSGARESIRNDSVDSLIQSLPEGSPGLGELTIKARSYGTQSMSTYMTFSFPLKGSPTFRQFFEAITSRHMDKFLFRKIGFAYCGCRDFLAQTYHWFVEENLIQAECNENGKTLYGLLGFRYTPTTIVGDIDRDDDSDDRESDIDTILGSRRIPNNIERGIFTSDYKRVLEDVIPYE